MAPIAPRYRGSKSRNCDAHETLSPILAIPDWSERTETEPESNESRSEIDGMELNEFGSTSVTSAGVSLADKKGLDEYARSLAEVCRVQLTPYLRSLPVRQSWRAVKGVTPGIVISISIICLWWMFGRDFSLPSQQQVIGDRPLNEESFEPIGEVPLRMASREGHRAEPVDSSEPDAATPADDRLFQRVEIIERSELATENPTANLETVDRTTLDDAAPDNATSDNATPGDAAVNGLSPDSKTPDGSSVDRENLTMDNPTSVMPTRDGRADAAHVDETRDTAAFTTNTGTGMNHSIDRSAGGRSQSEIEYEWTRQSRPATHAAASRQPSRPFGSTGPQRKAMGHPLSASGQMDTSGSSTEVYSYERTDPATYKDPDYVVPPVASRPSRSNH